MLRLLGFQTKTSNRDMFVKEILTLIDNNYSEFSSIRLYSCHLEQLPRGYSIRNEIKEMTINMPENVTYKYAYKDIGYAPCKDTLIYLARRIASKYKGSTEIHTSKMDAGIDYSRFEDVCDSIEVLSKHLTQVVAQRKAKDEALLRAERDKADRIKPC